MNKLTFQIRNIAEKVTTLWIDLSTQKKILNGIVKSIDGETVVEKTESTRYDMISQIFFKHFTLTATDVLIDVGCGKGRVFNYLLYKGLLNKMIGYEINPEVGMETKNNLIKFKNVTIVTDNIFDGFPSDANIFYVYNPFKLPMVNEFKERIWEIRKNEPVILYLHPVHIDAFDDERFVYETVEITHLKWTLNLAIIKIAS